MANRGWSCKSWALVLDCHPNKFPQGWYPARRKACLLLLANWEMTMRELLAECAVIHAEREAAGETMDLDLHLERSRRTDSTTTSSTTR